MLFHDINKLRLADAVAVVNRPLAAVYVAEEEQLLQAMLRSERRWFGNHLPRLVEVGGTFTHRHTPYAAGGGRDTVIGEGG